MNKWEKEVAQSLLNDEKEVIKEIEKQYKKALADIGEKIRILQSDDMTVSKIYHLQYQMALKAQVEGALNILHSSEFTTIQKYLNGCYTKGFIGTMYNLNKQGVPLLLPIDQKAMLRAILTDSKLKEDLYKSLGVDIAKLKKTITAEISRGIATGMPYTDIARNISNATGTSRYHARRIVNTEGHRIQQASTYDAQQAAKAKGADVVKQWDATLDGATREVHRELDGQIREVDEPFEAYGKKAMYPGDFGDPAEDCNCRCVSLTRARAALDEDELKILNDRAAFFGLDKPKNLEEYSTNYLKALENLPKSGIIKTGILNIGFQFFANKGLAKQNTKQLQKSIASWKEHIELHRKKVANPSAYDSGWDTKTEAHKAGLIRHWEHEIHTAEENIKLAIAEIESRG